MRHQLELLRCELQLNAGFKNLAVLMNEEISANFEAGHRERGREAGPGKQRRDQAMMSVMAANEAACFTWMSQVCMARMSTEPAL